MSCASLQNISLQQLMLLHLMQEKLNYKEGPDRWSGVLHSGWCLRTGKEQPVLFWYHVGWQRVWTLLCSCACLLPTNSHDLSFCVTKDTCMIVDNLKLLCSSYWLQETDFNLDLTEAGPAKRICASSAAGTAVLTATWARIDVSSRGAALMNTISTSLPSPEESELWTSGNESFDPCCLGVWF